MPCLVCLESVKGVHADESLNLSKTVFILITIIVHTLYNWMLIYGYSHETNKKQKPKILLSIIYEIHITKLLIFCICYDFELFTILGIHQITKC